MTTPGFPLPLRNALAALAVGALDDERDAAALAWLAAPADAPAAAVGERLAALQLVDPGERVLLAVHAPHAVAARAHAARAAAAAAAYRAHPTLPEADALGRAVAQAAALWDGGLFFEVHEVLEAAWKTAGGGVRQALQGLIQIAVAYHHLAHGNRRGARSLLREGRARLAASPRAALPAVDVEAILAATAPWEAALAGGGEPQEAPPRLPLRAPRPG